MESEVFAESKASELDAIVAEVAKAASERLGSASKQNRERSAGSGTPPGKLGPGVLEKFARQEADGRKDAIVEAVVRAAIAKA